MVSCRRHVTRKHQVVHQAGQHLCLNRSALQGIGYGRNLFQNHLQRQAPRAQVGEQFAFGQRQPGLQALGGIQRLLCHAAPQAACFVELAAAFELVRTTQHPGQRGLGLLRRSPVCSDRQRLRFALGACRHGQRRPAVQNLLVAGAQAGQHRIANQVVTARQTANGFAQQVRLQRQSGGRQMLIGWDVCHLGQHAQRHGLPDNRRRLDKGAASGCQRPEPALQHVAHGWRWTALGSSITCSGTRPLKFQQFLQCKRVAITQTEQALYMIRLKDQIGPALLAQGLYFLKAQTGQCDLAQVAAALQRGQPFTLGIGQFIRPGTGAPAHNATVRQQGQQLQTGRITPLQIIDHQPRTQTLKYPGQSF